MVFCKDFKVNFGHLLIFAVEFVEFQDRVRLALRIRRIKSELIFFPMLLNPNFTTFLALTEIKILTTVDTYEIAEFQKINRLVLTLQRPSVAYLRFHFY